MERIIVFQPGSLNFYFGTPSQQFPYCFPSVVAFKNWNCMGAPISIPSYSKYKFDQANFTSLQDVAKTLKLFNGETNPVFEFGQNDFNKKQKLIETETFSELKWLDSHTYSDTIVGENVLKMNPQEASKLGYEIKWIFENLSCIEDRTLSEQEKCLMGKVFLEAIATVYPKLPVSSYNTVKFILLIPDSFNRDIILGMLDVMFYHVKFEAGTLLQESVAVSYFLKNQRVCVVDIGHRKISVSCIEDGISLPQTRIWLNYGCDLVMGTFRHLWNSINCSLKDLDPDDNINYWQFLQTNTFLLCHLLKDVTPGADFEFNFDEPHSKILKFTSKFGDEPLLAPMSLFCQVFLKSLNFKTASLFRYNDFHTKHELLDDEQYIELASSLEMLSRSYNAGADRRNALKSEVSVNRGTSIEIRDGVMPIDEAIYKSISASGNSEATAKYLNNIHIVGCGTNIAGMGEFMKHRLQAFVPRGKGLKSSSIEVITSYKDCSPEHVAWKGACVGVNMRCFSDILIQCAQWENQRVGILREKSIFEWIPISGT